MDPAHLQGARRGFSAVGWWRTRGGRLASGVDVVLVEDIVLFGDLVDDNLWSLSEGMATTADAAVTAP